ncbi:hypothetical protein F4781DRAFT_401116 [Annulohypoxylon bovei var. microspora]|nr:hypothetical protein F4781DRAFT_401116 [Annulohypoxylon bovei var. microspora]
MYVVVASLLSSKLIRAVEAASQPIKRRILRFRPLRKAETNISHMHVGSWEYHTEGKGTFGRNLHIERLFLTGIAFFFGIEVRHLVIVAYSRLCSLPNILGMVP